MKGWVIGVGALLACAAAAGADVKTGVDAWGRGDYRKAVDEWRPLALAGDPDAEFNLGQAYKLGRGVPLDPALARSWFLKAATQGHVQAEDNYGLSLFQDGKRAEAAPWLDKSAGRGEPRAQLVLGTMLFNGDGVPRDFPRAYALVTRASQQGLKSAGDTLAQMDGYLSPDDRQRGTDLAQRYAAEQNARLAAGLRDNRIVAPIGSAPRPVPAAIASAGGRRPAPAARPTPRPAPGHAVAAGPLPGAVPAAPAGGSAGGWRVQLGAFRDAGNAHALWAKVGARIGGTPVYATGGGITRLRAGPFASRAAAQHACAAAGATCTVVAP